MRTKKTPKTLKTPKTPNLPATAKPPATRKPSKKSLPAGKDRSAAAEFYRAPAPPAHGRIIGLDCHPDTFTAAVFRGSTPHDARKLQSRENLSLQELLAWVAKEFTSKDLFLLEAGSNSFEIHRRLFALGLRAVVLESAHVGKHAKTYADNDKMAAARIALVYLAGNAPCVWVPDAQSSERRELLHAYQTAVVNHTAATNGLKSYLNQFGVRVGKRSLHLERTRAWILQQRPWSALQRELLSAYLAQLDHQNALRKKLFTLIAERICAEPLMLRCLKLLGIGVINAFALLAIIGQVERFATPAQLVSYVGLNPGQRQSGHGKNVKLGIGHRGRGDLRHLLTQAAQAVLRAGRQTTLGQWGWKLFARKGHRNIAVSAVARKLLVQVWHSLSGNPPTSLEPNPTLAHKLERLAVTLGKSLRVQLQLPASLAECVRELHNRLCSAPSCEPV